MFNEMPLIKFEFDKGKYELGDDMKVRVTITGKKNLQIESAKLEFFCEESVVRRNKFFRHHRVNFYPFREVRILEGKTKITPLFQHQYDHTFPIFPEKPPTYQREMDVDLVSVSWKLMINLERKDKSSLLTHVEIPTYSTRIDFEDQPFSAGKSFEKADLQISIPKTHFKAGEVVEGEITVKPKQNFKAIAKVQLLRVERVFSSGVPSSGLQQIHNEAENTPISTDPPKSRRDYREGKVKESFFKIPISRSMRPSYRTKTSEVEWIVCGSLVNDELSVTAPIVVVSS